MFVGLVIFREITYNNILLFMIATEVTVFVMNYYNNYIRNKLSLCIKFNVLNISTCNRLYFKTYILIEENISKYFLFTAI